MRESVFDFVAGKTAVLFQDKPVAALTPWVLRSYNAAVEAGLDFVLLTPGTTRITFPLSEVLGAGAGRWLVTSADGSFYDGMTGRGYVWENDALSAGDTLEDEFLTAETEQSGYVHARAVTLHPASYRTRAGSFTEQIFAAVTGTVPSGWGVCEPVSEPWDVQAASAYCRKRSPQTTRLEVVGRGVAGTTAANQPSAGSVGVMTVERTARGVLETVELLADIQSPLAPEQVNSFAEGAHRARARTAVLGQGVGYTDLNRPARFTGLVVPRCAVFGAESLAAVGARQAVAAAGSGARLTGAAPMQSLVVEYQRGPEPGRPHPMEAFADLARTLAADAVG